MSNLTYVSDKNPGISRIARGRGFQYMMPNNRPIADESQLTRIKKLGLPPAYTNVWICPQINGHIQATGLDSASRKQYRYHDKWTEFRNQQKFDQLPEFSVLLPKIRRRVSNLLKNKNRSDVLTKDVAAAALVRLIDQTAIRVGGRSRTSKGATTLDMKNVKYDGGRLQFRFVAKGGKRVQCSLRDARLQRALEIIDDLPGKRLFQYIGVDGDVHPLDSGDVNQWLKDVSGADFVSAKIFRTWHGSVAALKDISENANPTIKSACEAAAETLRNSPAICRKSYVHPAVLELAEDSPEQRDRLLSTKDKKITGLRVFENRLAKLIA